ncbi:winged helix DNA-binding domain-containing protein [Streptomyces sp. NBC_01373]|uniref:winged helix DNA-binding domain-containing protein n=1 Tax=Streptomyces sp. NBC_01373 TaxID=2903843 RepID=UPI00225914CC|nr:winged helix DNA-binding domain-containing protein [Streptomyces sp. NBC_01373]MCX4698184.1 winged helix DNA-binding domain-containing protein [Streptomyces sp. NBC_01373]
MTVRITWDQASARRLARQFLATPAKEGTPAADIVGAMLAAHAQVLSAAEVSVGVRSTGTTRADVRAALWEDRSLVKTHGPRGTVHLLAARELPVWSAALTAVPSGASLFAPDARVTEEQARQIVAAIGDALDGVCLTIDELSEEVVARTGPWAGDPVMPAFQDMWPRWRQVMHRAGQSGALCFGPNRGRKVTYTRPPHFAPLPAQEAVRELVRRYLRAYGPSTPAYFAKWLAAPGGWAGGLFRELAEAGEIEEVAFEGAPAWVAAGDTAFPDGPVRGVRLLPYFDAYGIAVQPRELLFPGAAYERALARGQAGNFPVLLVDGVVAGVWHQRRQGRRTTVTVEPLGRLTARQERELAEQAERVGEVLEANAELVVGEVTAGPHA